MRRPAILAAILVGLAVLTAASPASAMYHPTVGRWVQRDPGPQGQVAPRIGQYHDGMNLYQYVRSAPTLYVDDTGAASKSLGEAMQGYQPRPATPPADGAAVRPAPSGGYGFRVPDAALRAGLQKTMKDMCDCFDYKDNGDGRITIADKFPSDKGGLPSREFCCCYYKKLPGCNLIMKYRDEGGAKPFPVAQDFPVVKGEAWRGYSTMGTTPVKHTFSHELIHGVYGYDDTVRPAIYAAVALIDPTQAIPGGTNQTPEVLSPAKKMLEDLVKDRAGCSRRPEFGENPRGATADTAAAMNNFKQHVEKAKTIYEKVSGNSW